MTHRTKPKKYRPVLTAVQIAHILVLAKTETPLSHASISVITTLAPFLAKIENAGIQAAYTEAPDKPSVADSLGFTLPLTEAELDPTANATSKEEYWEQCYIAYIKNPAYLSLDQIQAAKEHMYLNDLMTAEEAKDFESNIGES